MEQYLKDRFELAIASRSLPAADHLRRVFTERALAHLAVCR